MSLIAALIQSDRVIVLPASCPNRVASHNPVSGQLPDYSRGGINPSSVRVGDDPDGNEVPLLVYRDQRSRLRGRAAVGSADRLVGIGQR